jgi:nitroreductase
MFRNMIKKTIHKSQHVQRNFDLSKQIPEEDRLVIEEAVTQCPSKQNAAFYDVVSITDRETIERIHETTKGFGLEDGTNITNSQTLANMLLVFLSREPHKEFVSDMDKRADAEMAVGIAAGYTNFISSMLGYGTGCCKCFMTHELQEILVTDREPILMMGIGYADEERHRREHHVSGEMFPTRKKEAIHLERID